MKFSSPLVQEYLASQRIGRLATSTPDGAPHVVAVSFTNDEINLYLSTFTRTKKVRNIRRNGKTAFIVDDGGGSVGWRYVIVEGDGFEITDGAEFEYVRDMLSSKYPAFNTEEWAIRRETHTLVRIEPRKTLAANLE